MIRHADLRSSGDYAADRRYAWAVDAAAGGDMVAAADLFAQTLERVPAWPPALLGLGEALAACGDVEAAAEAFLCALDADPTDRLGAGLRLARLGRRDPAAAMTPSWVAAVFDEYAPRFDTHLVAALGYRGPALLVAALDAAADPTCRFPVALDLGCGTGLAGAALRARIGHLAGCDLSAAMIERARVRGTHDRLAVTDMETFLAAEPAGSADLVLAADVLIYVADPAPLMTAVARVLAPGGLFALTAEDDPGAAGDAPLLGPTLRWSHPAPLLRRMAAAAGLAVRSCVAASCRREADRDVPGLVLVLARDA
ncbi:MAG: methyltransferase domain-containing protein [Alsobacter sp.]